MVAMNYTRKFQSSSYATFSVGMSFTVEHQNIQPWLHGKQNNKNYAFVQDYS